MDRWVARDRRGRGGGDGKGALKVSVTYLE